jgi:hypothetical protein
MSEETNTTQEPRRPWTAPAIQTSDVFTKAALACCLDEFGDEVGSTGVNTACPD